ncbi:MAG: phage head-tail connector protein [Negativicutes bacterium]|jgi:uncharacterized phiE125 gp8 family phage protein
MPLKLITPPTAQPLHVADVRQHLKQDILDDDNLILLYLGAAVEFAQMQTQRQLVSARYQYVLDGFPGYSLSGVPLNSSFSIPAQAIQIPRTPLMQVVSIQYTAMDGTTQTMPSTDYTVDQSCEPPRITPVFGKIWPIPLPQIGSVRVTFDAGYIAPIASNSTANTITAQAWKALVVGDNIRLSNSGGALPTPLQPKTDYFIQSVVSAGVYTLAASSGGSVIDITDTGTGLNFIGQPGLNGSTGELPDGIKSWMLLRCDSLYSHRGETANTRGTIAALPYVDRLLDPYQVVLM